MQLGARVAVWGLSPQKVCIDVQYSSFAAIKEIDINQLKSVFENYEAIVKSPKDYGFKIEQ